MDQWRKILNGKTSLITVGNKGLCMEEQKLTKKWIVWIEPETSSDPLRYLIDGASLALVQFAQFSFSKRSESCKLKPNKYYYYLLFPM